MKKEKLLNLYKDGFGGGTPKTSIESYWNGKIPWFQSSDLDEGTVSVKKVHKYITSEAIEQTSAKLIPANSIAIVTRVGVGKVALIPYEYATSQDFNSLARLNVDPEFGVYYVYKLMNILKNKLQGTSIKGITKDDLNNSKIIISDSIHEQQHIGNFFSKLDHLIDLHSQKLEQLKKLKRGYLQKMFPQKGETVPRLRFNGFSDDWKEIKYTVKSWKEWWNTIN